MGSFYATCSITKTTLSQQKTYFQLLVPSYLNIRKDKDSGEYKDSRTNHIRSFDTIEKGLQVSDSGAVSNFLPFGFPIKGEYYDYGRVDNYKKDKNIELLESFFNLDIENIMRASSRSSWISELEELDVVDSAKDKRGYDRKIDDYLGLDGTTPIKNVFILENLNCTYFRGEIYDFLCKGWDKLKTQGKSKWNEYFPQFYTTIKNMYVEKDDEDEILDKLGKLYDIKKTRPLTSKEDIKSTKLRRQLRSFSGEAPETYLSRYSSKADFIRMMPYHMEEFEEDYRKQFQFIRTLGWGMNYILTPSIYGSQDVNFKLIRDMNRQLDKLLAEDLAYYDDYEDDEEKREETLDILLKDKKAATFAKDFIKQKFGSNEGYESLDVKKIQKIVELAYVAGKQETENIIEEV